MQENITLNRRFRKDFGQTDVVAAIPNLIEVQKNSYDRNFLQLDIPVDKRLNSGLQAVFNSIFPIEDPLGTASLEFVKYHFDLPKYDVEECSQRGVSYSAPLKVTLRLIVWDVDEDTGSRDIRGIKEQEVYMGDIPLMTINGTFIINGVERVVVSQMHRSPGVFFDHDSGKTHSSGKFLYSARIIPYRGSWIDLEFDAKELMHFRIDRRRKLHITTLLFALGMSKSDIADYYYDKEEYVKTKTDWKIELKENSFDAQSIAHDLVDDATGKKLLEKGSRVNPRIIKKHLENGVKFIRFTEEDLVGKYLAEDIVNEETGEIVAQVGEYITTEIIAQINELGLEKLPVIKFGFQQGSYLLDTMNTDKSTDFESATLEIFKILRPGEPPTLEAGQALFNNLFFDQSRYDLSDVGRLKLNTRTLLDIPEDTTILTKEDIKTVIKILIEIKDGTGSVDDIDHLGNRRVRSVGELIENQFRIGLLKMQKTVIEKMGVVEVDTVMPHDLINPKALVSVVREFFGTSQLSQFMDQTNPLSEITHKRRISALGPGGLNRERAGFEVRDVHPTHYGRICPIETPEGQNIGLINSLATFARVNKYGFIESPYRKVLKGKVTGEVVYLSAIDELEVKIAPVVEIDNNGSLKGDLINCRVDGDFVMVPPDEVEYVDVVPMQLVSVASAMIPFLENNDANRALMGANMQRQAVPLLRSDAPLVGTGVEGIVAKNSGAALVSLEDGVVEMVDSSRIVIRGIESRSDGSPGVDIYNLVKFRRSNHSTCINQKPLVRIGQNVKKGEIIADGPSMDRGEVALGRNVLVAFLSWSGYNFKDSIVVSEKLVSKDAFTSIHIEGFEIIARDTRLGPEEVTRDIPNITDEQLSHLDEVGIVNLGAEVEAGDILVGKVTPKSESPMTPEEKLLKAIFGEKAADVRDSSLRVPPGVSGTVVEVRVFSRRGIEKDERTLLIEKQQIDQLTKDRDDELKIIEFFVKMKFISLFKGQKVAKSPKAIKISGVLTEEIINNTSLANLKLINFEEESLNQSLNLVIDHYESKRDEINDKFHSKVQKLQSGDDLPQGALKVVKVFIATKHRLQSGDKMAGRHGNKGIVSRIVPEEDMPFLEDGTVVDILLNPLGIPSRMNVGQVLETHLGWASVNLGKKIDEMLDDYHSSKENVDDLKVYVEKIFGENSEVCKKVKSMSDDEFIKFVRPMKDGVSFSTPVFDGAKVDDVENMLLLSGVSKTGQSRLLDGRTGDYFDRDVTVGYKYMLKLHHLVDDKLHARSIGPYSLVTQQPLGGKSHFGGQRFGEMECWALQAYGAAYTLQEMLTVKSDDVTGRIKIYESIIKGDSNFEYSVPESFNVMVKELKSLCLNIQFKQDSEE